MYETIKARVIAQMPEDALWNSLPQIFNIEFDDGVVMETISARVIMSWYLWWPVREFEKAPINSTHFFGNEDWGSGTPLKYMNACWQDCFETHGRNINPEYGALRIKQELNRLFNATCIHLQPYFTSIDIVDIAEVMFHPEIKKITDFLQSRDQNDIVVRSQMDRYIDDAYENATRILRTDKSIFGSNLSRPARSGISDMRQLLQTILVRGRTTDMFNNAYTWVIARGFAHGLFTLADIMMEAGTAGKSANAQGSDLQAVEYFNRQLQLLCCTLSKLDSHWQHTAEGNYTLHDCGTTRYLSWKVTKENFSSLLGCHMFTEGVEMLDAEGKPTGRLVPETAKFKEITNDDKEIIETVIRLRNPAVCEHPEENTICAACLGAAEHSIPAGTNIGHLAAIVLCAIVSQAVLSTKHCDSSVNAGDLSVDEEAAQFLRVAESHQEFAFRFNLKTDEVKLILDAADVKQLNDIYEVKDVHSLAPRRICTMNSVYFLVEDDIEGESYTRVAVSRGSDGSAFSHDFLEHIKNVGYTTREDKHVCISLKGFDTSKPVWVMSRRHANMLDFMEEIKQRVKMPSSGRDKLRNNEKLNAYLGNAEEITQYVREFYDLIRDKFDFPVSLLGVIMRATMVVSRENNDYRIPSGTQVGQFAPFSDIMEMRSCALGAGFEKQLTSLYTNPKSFIYGNRSASAMDEIFYPTPTYIYGQGEKA